MDAYVWVIIRIKGTEVNLSYLSQDIQKAYDQLIDTLSHIPASKRCDKMIEGTGGRMSASDLISYQIGWGMCLIRWYEAGIRGVQPEMPGDGFLKWDYVELAKHFYQKYAYDASNQQLKVFHEVVVRIMEIVEKERATGNLDREEIWPWCTLSSGKTWPLSKWIKVNTVSPYRRAAQLIKKACKNVCVNKPEQAENEDFKAFKKTKTSCK